MEIEGPRGSRRGWEDPGDGRERGDRTGEGTGSESLDIPEPEWIAAMSRTSSLTPGEGAMDQAA
jgi:hypothetical protein